MTERTTLIDELQSKFKSLDETLWEGRVQWPLIQKWASQFKSADDAQDDEIIQMLFLASHFMYFGTREIRCLLRSLYRDLFQYPIVAEIRKNNGDTTDRKLIEDLYKKELAATRFLGVGNPSESGSHILYYFRQENGLGKKFFINSIEIFEPTIVGGALQMAIRDESVRRYVFIDDLCGSGSQVSLYTGKVVKALKDLDQNISVLYLPLFATSFGLGEVRKLGVWSKVASVVELDDSFRCFSDDSRIYQNEQIPYELKKAKSIAEKYGRDLQPSNPFGYKDGQLLLGFCYNTPDNTLPIIWYDEPIGKPWIPLFRRYPKQYGWQS